MQSTEPCSISGCVRPVYVRGWCTAHYNRWHQTGDVRADVPIRTDGLTAYERVVRAGWTVTDTGCWETNLVLNRNGYGRVYGLGGRAKRRNFLAHRVVVESTYRALEPGEFACHHCDNPPCVNPAHLFVGTNSDNVADMISKDRDRFGERSHLTRFTDDQIQAVRDLYATGRFTQRVLAERFGISQSHVSALVNMKSRLRPTHT